MKADESKAESPQKEQEPVVHVTDPDAYELTNNEAEASNEPAAAEIKSEEDLTQEHAEQHREHDNSQLKHSTTH